MVLGLDSCPGRSCTCPCHKTLEPCVRCDQAVPVLWTINSPEPPTKEQMRVAAAEAKASVAKAETALNYARARLEFLQTICKPHEYLKGYCATCGLQERSNYHDDR